MEGRGSASAPDGKRAPRHFDAERRRQLRRHLPGVLLRVAAVLLGLELFYLAAGNLVLRTGLIKSALASSDGFRLEYDGAYTLWPGRVHLRDFSLRVEDYNVQFEVALDAAEVDIALSELPFKKFHVTRLLAHGTRFRMRHKLIVVGQDAERVAAYPPIRGFADPPYYVGIPSPPTPDEQYDLWQVRLDDITAHVRELWILEYRYQGKATARGAFALRPERWVHVKPARLELAGGRITLGAHTVAGRAHGRIDCEIPDMRVQEVEGRQVFNEISGGVRLRLEQGQLDYLGAYLTRFAGLRFSGSAEYRVDVELQKGVVQSGSRISARATPLRVQHQRGTLAGDVMFSLERAAERSPDTLLLAASAPRLSAGRASSERAAPELEGLAASLKLEAVDLSGPLALRTLTFAVQQVRIPDLAWFSTSSTKLAGSMTASLSVTREESESLRVRGKLDASGLSVARGGISLHTGAQAMLSLARPAGASRFDAKSFEIRLRGARLAAGGERSEAFGLTLDGSQLSLSPGAELLASGPVDVRLSSAQALLPLLVDAPLPWLASTALDLDALSARAQLRLSRDGLQLDGLDARSGELRLRGHVAERGEGATGALLLSSGLVNVGILLQGGSSELSPFVADDWLAGPAAARDARPRG